MNKFKNTILTSDFRGLLSSFKLDSLNSCIVLKKNESNITEFITELERNSFVSFSKKYNLSIDEFFKPYQRIIKFNNTQLLLGASAYLNLFEIYRKTAQKNDLSAICENEFNELFKNYLTEVEYFLQRGESLKDQLYALSKRHYKVYAFIKPIVDLYFKDGEFKELLLYNSQLVSGRIYSSKVKYVEALYYTLNFIGDYFRVDSIKLNNYLVFKIKELNRTLYISNDIRLYKDSIVTDELVLNPRNVRVYDHYSDLQFNAKKLTVYKSLTISAELKDVSSYYLNKVFFINNSDSFGSTCPHTEVIFENNSIMLKYFYKKEAASKEGFYIDKAMNQLLMHSKNWDIDLANSTIKTFSCEKLYCTRDGYIFNKDNVNSIYADDFNAHRYQDHSQSSNMYMGATNSLSRLFNS